MWHDEPLKQKSRSFVDNYFVWRNYETKHARSKRGGGGGGEGGGGGGGGGVLYQKVFEDLVDAGDRELAEAADLIQLFFADGNLYIVIFVLCDMTTRRLEK